MRERKIKSVEYFSENITTKYTEKVSNIKCDGYIKIHYLQAVYGWFYSHSIYFYSKLGFCAVSTILRTNQPTDRPNEETVWNATMYDDYACVLVCLVACMRISICALVIWVCTWSLYRRMYVNSSVHNGIVKNTSIELEKENRIFNKDNYDICLWNVFNLHNRHSLCTYPFQLFIPLNTWLFVNKYEITYPCNLFI